MTGLRKRVMVGFLSIVCLLFFSGMVSFVELSHLSRDTGEILKANMRNIELAKEMLDAAHEQNVALIRLSVFGDRSCDSLCRRSLERLENTLLVAQDEALEKSLPRLARLRDDRAAPADRQTIWPSEPLRRRCRGPFYPIPWGSNGITTSTWRSTGASRRPSRTI